MAFYDLKPERVRTLVEQSGQTQEEAAQAIGITRRRLLQILSQERDFKTGLIPDPPRIQEETFLSIVEVIEKWLYEDADLSTRLGLSDGSRFAIESWLGDEVDDDGEAIELALARPRDSIGKHLVFTGKVLKQDVAEQHLCDAIGAPVGSVQRVAVLLPGGELKGFSCVLLASEHDIMQARRVRKKSVPFWPYAWFHGHVVGVHAVEKGFDYHAEPAHEGTAAAIHVTRVDVIEACDPRWRNWAW